MKTFRVSVSEMWARIYEVDAETSEEAISKYVNWYMSGLDESDAVRPIGEPEYVDDNLDDILVFDPELNTYLTN